MQHEKSSPQLRVLVILLVLALVAKVVDTVKAKLLTVTNFSPLLFY